MSSFHWFARTGSCRRLTENTTGRPLFSATRRSMSNSDLVSGSSQSDVNSMKPELASLRPMAMPASSSSLARSVGVYSPVRLLWLMVREVEKLKAPALIASCAILRICDIGWRRLVVADGAVTHHEDADGGVREQRAEVDVALPGRERLEILGEGLPCPFETLVHDRSGNVLDAFHQLDELLSVSRLAGREA